MFLKGECADFPDSWSDRMWGPDDLPNQRTQYELRRAAVRICEACPVRAECLAFGIMVRDQYGIYGGLPLRARRQVLKTAREAGFRFDPDDPTAERRLARYIRANPEIVAAARERECKRRKTEQRNARQQRWRATTRSTGKAKAPAAATHTPPLQDTLFCRQSDTDNRSGPIRTNHSGNPYTRQTVEPCTRGHGKPETRMKGTIPMTTNTKTVAFVNLKGGVGKNTSAIGTAEALARLGHTVTARDADPSGAATLWAHKALSAGRPLPFGVKVVSRFTVAAPAEEESWRSTSR